MLNAPYPITGDVFTAVIVDGKGCGYDTGSITGNGSGHASLFKKDGTGDPGSILGGGRGAGYGGVDGVGYSCWLTNQ